MVKKKEVLIIGAGPAGLAAAYGLLKAKNTKVTILDMDNQIGGLSKTVEFNGYKFDLGGHRFFSKLGVVKDIWSGTMGKEFLRRKRLSRIYYQNKFYFYPLKIKNAFSNLGILESAAIGLSYLHSKIFPYKKEASFEEYVSNRFGKKLYAMFFKTYTEKVWGMPAREIRAEWAAQRIKGLSLTSAVFNALSLNKNKKNIKTLIDEFDYPRYGPGMLYERLASKILSDQSFRLRLNHKINRIRRHGNRWKIFAENREGKIKEFVADEVISTMPLTEFVQLLEPKPEKKVITIAKGLKYRDFLVACIVFDKKTTLEDTWLYIHDNSVNVGRVQVIFNWSPFMVRNKNSSAYGVEYFCTEGDALWTMDDRKIINLAEFELKKIGLIPKEYSLSQGNVVRCRKAYPVYDSFYNKNIGTLRKFVSSLPNIQVAGRYGMFKYNNMDHSIYTGLLAAQNIIEGTKKYDLWAVNQDKEYHEEMTEKV